MYNGIGHHEGAGTPNKQEPEAKQPPKAAAPVKPAESKSVPPKQAK